jgi:adenine-specific DNA-methyltransferase
LNELFGGTLKPYEELQAEYQAVQRQNRRFGLTKYVPYTNVWDFKPVPWYPGQISLRKIAGLDAAYRRGQHARMG